MLNLKAAGLWSQGCALTLNYILMCFAAFGNKRRREKAGHLNVSFLFFFDLCTFCLLKIQHLQVRFSFFFNLSFLLPFEVSPVHWV